MKLGVSSIICPPAFIKDVDVEKKIIVVMLIKGLIDED